MKTIYKYPADVVDDLVIMMPKGAQVLGVQMQGKGPQIWALVDTAAPAEARRFHWRGTGHPADDLGRYVGTIQASTLVFHLFETLREGR